MPFVDRIIQFLQAQQGERIVLESDQFCVVYRAGGLSAPTKDRLSMAQIRGLVTEILPEHKKAAFAAGESFLFEYPYGSGTMEIEVDQLDGKTRVSIGVPEVREPSTAHPSEARVRGDDAGPGKRVERLDDLFRLLKEREGSDLHMNASVRPMFRVNGDMVTLYDYEATQPDHIVELLYAITPKRNIEEFERDHDTDFSYSIPGLARFRCNLFMDRHGAGGNFRLIPSHVSTAKELGLTKQMLDLCFLSKGLVLVTGPTGTGKSTTLAALVDYVNRSRQDHIITIEDPIEFVHENVGCLVNQREVHTHTESFARALRAALREDPDIVLVGEMRDLETVAIAIETAETGHLVFGTLHTSTAPSTVDRIIDQFPADQQAQIRVMLSESLKAVIAQTLCRTKAGPRVAAFEVLLVDPAAANLIREGKTYQLPSIMQIGRNRGCTTMNDSLLALVKSGRVEAKEAYFKSVDKPGLLGLFEAEEIKFAVGHGG